MHQVYYQSGIGAVSNVFFK